MRLRNTLNNLSKRSFFFLCACLPVKRNTVFIESFAGLSYACNPKYLYEEMIKQNMQYNYVWSFRDTRQKLPGNPKLVTRFSLKYYYYLATSKFLLNNTEFAQNLPIRKQQIYINTQHGTPLKKMGRHQLDDKKNRKPKTGRWTYLLSQNKYSSTIFKDAYMFDGKILEFGYPRNDIFFKKNTKNDIEQIKLKYKLPLNKKVVLYAPTWRKGDSKLHIDIEIIKNKLPSDLLLLVRLHHLVSSTIKPTFFDNEFLFDCSSSVFDMQELCLISDILVTDYSSVMFDYANLNKPMIFYAYDWHKYQNNSRGVYLELNDIAPGKIVKTELDLIETIEKAIDSKIYMNSYQEKYNTFANKFCRLDEGESSIKVIKQIFN